MNRAMSLLCALCFASTPAMAAQSPWMGSTAGGHHALTQDRVSRPGVLSPGQRRGGERAAPVVAVAVEGESHELQRMVYGYLPYWEMGYDVPHWELLGVLAWFAVGMDAEGQAIDFNGWGGAASEALVDEAHANQTPVVVTVTNFDNDGIGALLESESRRATAIQTCLDLMAIHSADGVNIDFEFVPSSAKADFVTFMADLKEAVAAVQPNGWEGHVTLAGPAVDWGGAYDYDQLLIHTDGIMIMGYGYHWGGGNPGPNAPLFGGGIWGPNSIASTIDDYLQWGGVENREGIIVGLPWYGRRWPVADTSVPGEALGEGKAVWFDDALAEAAVNGAQYDEDSHTPYYHRESGGELWQVWYDDQASFGEKLAYIVEKDLGGIGLWALGYEGDEDGYWQEIADHLAAPVNEIADGETTPPEETTPPVTEPEDGEGEDTQTSDSEVTPEPEEMEEETEEGASSTAPRDGEVGGDEPHAASDTGSSGQGPSISTTTPTVSAQHASIRTEETAASGCSTGPASGGGAAVLLVLGLLLMMCRRRAYAG